MSAPLRISDSPAPANPALDVRKWLDLVGTLSGLPAAEMKQVRDELADHIEGRSNDLMLLGKSESAAVEQALSELGDAAKLAFNLRRARSIPRRRSVMMNIGIVVLAGLGVGAGVVGINAMNPGGSVPKAVFEPKTDAAAAPAQQASIELHRGTPWGAFFELAAGSAGLPVAANWAELRDAGIVPDGEMPDMPTGRFTFPTIMKLANDALHIPSPGQLDWRVIDGNLVFSTVAAFDRLETVVVTYDLSSVPGIEFGGDDHGNGGTMERVCKTIMHHCDAEAWVDNGGDRASLTEIGRKLFVKAPKRIHAQIDWILSEVATTGTPTTNKAGGAGGGMPGGLRAIGQGGMSGDGSVGDQTGRGAEDAFAGAGHGAEAGTGAGGGHGAGAGGGGGGR